MGNPPVEIVEDVFPIKIGIFHCYVSLPEGTKFLVQFLSSWVVIQGEDGRPPSSWGFFPYAALAMLTALQRKGLSKRAQLKVSVVEIYLEPWAGKRKGCRNN